MFELPKLSYPYNALEPYIDEETMRIHHTKHHQAYVDKLNAALEGKSYLLQKPIDEILKDLNKIPEEIRMAVRNHGGGHYNHSIFWKMMAPSGQVVKDKIPGQLKEALDSAFGSFDSFKEKFTSVAVGHFGSGWAWLVVKNSKLEVKSLPNQDTPLSNSEIPILGLDVWEHAYYLKYQNRRNEYVEAFWNVVNWPQVEENFKKSLQ